MAGTAVYVFLYKWKTTNYKKAEGNLILFISLGGLGIGLWLLYNLLIFGYPFYFAFNEFSAFAQQTAIAYLGELLTKGNLVLSFLAYTQAVILTQGIIFSLLAVIGILVFTVKSRLSISSLSVFIFLIPFVFNVFALYKGQSVIWTPNIPPYFNTFFNVRYGLLMIPAVAVFIGILAKSNLMKIIIIPAIFAQIILFYSYLPGRSNHLSFVALSDTVASINSDTVEATNWLRKNYDRGLVMVSSASSESFIFRSGLVMRTFITEGTGKYWKMSLVNPAKYAAWVVFFPSYTDRVGKVMKTNPILNSDYDLVFRNNNYLIYKLRAASTVNIRQNISNVNAVKANALESRKQPFPEEYILINQMLTYIKSK
jgi:hypothetical protein